MTHSTTRKKSRFKIKIRMKLHLTGKMSELLFAELANSLVVRYLITEIKYYENAYALHRDHCILRNK